MSLTDTTSVGAQVTKLKFKRDRLAKFLRGYPGTWSMADLFSIIAKAFEEPVGEVTIRRVVRQVADKNSSKRWTTWTIYARGTPYYPEDHCEDIINTGHSSCSPSTGHIDQSTEAKCPVLPVQDLKCPAIEG